MSARAIVKRGRVWGKSTSYGIQPSVEMQPGSNLACSYTFGNFQEELHHCWDVEIPALPQLNMSLFSWADALAYANQTVRKLRGIGGAA